MELERQNSPSVYEDKKRKHPSTAPNYPKTTRTIDLFDSFELIGEGTYGKVFRARNRETHEVVALKKLLLENEQEGFPLTAIREIKILKRLHHENVVELKEIVTSQSFAEGKREVYMVFEYSDHDLSGLMHRDNWKPSLPDVKQYMKQLLQGLYHCHNNNVLHRDIKPSNLLVDNKGQLKLADFGLARPYLELNNLTNKVVTLWYRPPELLLGASRYGPEIDMWSAGCILVELLTGRAIFNGRSEIDQLDTIFKYCGVPDKETWPNVDQLPSWNIYRAPKDYRRCLGEYLQRKFPNMITKEALDLIDRLIALDPKKRITASEALDHDFFWNSPEPTKPSDLPKFPSTHEYTSKKRRQEQQNLLPNESNKRHKGPHGAGVASTHNQKPPSASVPHKYPVHSNGPNGQNSKPSHYTQPQQRPSYSSTSHSSSRPTNASYNSKSQPPPPPSSSSHHHHDGRANGSYHPGNSYPKPHQSQGNGQPSKPLSTQSKLPPSSNDEHSKPPPVKAPVSLGGGSAPPQSNGQEKKQ